MHHLTGMAILNKLISGTISFSSTTYHVLYHIDPVSSHWSW